MWSRSNNRHSLALLGYFELNVGAEPQDALDVNHRLGMPASRVSALKTYSTVIHLVSIVGRTYQELGILVGKHKLTLQYCEAVFPRSVPYGNKRN